LEETHFGIYSSDSELMDTSNTSGRDLQCTVLLSSEKLISYIKIHLPQSRVLKIIQNGFSQASPCSCWRQSCINEHSLSAGNVTKMFFPIATKFSKR
jgi:hypothetical protein